MEVVYREFDGLKMEMETLRAEYVIKTELYEALRKAHNEQLGKIKNIELQLQKQAQELNAKSEEIFEMRQKYDELKSCLSEKESLLRQLTSVNEKLRADFGDKVQTLEEKNRDLVLVLDEATLRNKDFEHKICACNEEIEGLKRLLLVSEKKYLEAERKAQAPKEVILRDQMIVKLEEENSYVQDQLNWKKEQFKHLEDAFDRVKDQFWSSKEDWEREKSELLKEISTLHAALESQTKFSEGLKTQLMMCNQALAHEERRRKILEVQVSEFNSRFENVFVECQEAKSKIDDFAVQRDDDIARLRNLLATKETHSKEMEFRIMHLEEENQELQDSLKALKVEAQVSKAGAGSSLMKLRRKLHCLAQMHGNCSRNLQERETEWSSQLKRLKEEMSYYISEVNDKSKQIQELQQELEGCHSSIEVLNEEVSLIFMVLKSEFSEAYTMLLNARAAADLHNEKDEKVLHLTKQLDMKNIAHEEKEEKIFLLTKQLEMKNCALKTALVNLELEGEEVALLRKRAESFNLMEQQHIFMEEEQERLKTLVESSAECQISLNEKILQLEDSLRKEKDFSESLKAENRELAQKLYEKGEIEIELQESKCIIANLKVSIEESQEIHKQMEASLHAQEEIIQTLQLEKERLVHNGKEREKTIGCLEEQIVLLETAIAAKMELVKVSQQERENYLQLAEEKDNTIENLHKEMDRLKESMRREFEDAILMQLNAEKAFDQERERLLQVIKVKDKRIEDLNVLTLSMEKDLSTALTSSFLEITEKQVQIDVLGEAWEKVGSLAKLEVQKKENRIGELEKEVSDLGHELVFHKESFFHWKQEAEQLEASLEKVMLENKKLTNQIRNEKRSFEGQLEKLQFGKDVLLEDVVKLSLERENNLVYMESICDWIDKFSCNEVNMMEKLERMLQISEAENGATVDLIANDELNGSPGNNANTSSTIVNKFEVMTEERLPLQELNH